jgi:transcription elongation factor Elf1
MSDEDRVYLCTACHWEKVPYMRWQKGLTIKNEEERKKYFTCLPCGEEQARAVKHTPCTRAITCQPASQSNNKEG